MANSLITPRVFSQTVQAPGDSMPHASNRRLDPNVAPQATNPSAEANAGDAENLGTPEEQGPLSPKFLALARREKALRKQMQDLKAREDAIKAKEEEYSTGYVSKDALKKDPMSILTEQGVSYDEIVQAALNQPGPQDQVIKKLMADLEGVKTAQQQQVEAQKAGEAQAYEQALGQIRNDVKLLIDGEGDAFELVRSQDSVEDVVQLIRQTFEETGSLLTAEDAAKQVEDHLFEHTKKLLGLSKVKGLFSQTAEAGGILPSGQVPAQNAAQKLEAAVAQKLQTPIKTLTNAQTTVPSKPLSAKERRERAIAAFKGNARTA